MSDEPRIKNYFVYATPCKTTDKDIGAVFYKLTDEDRKEKCLPETLPEQSIYSGKVMKGLGRPGTIYSFEQPADKLTSVFPGTRQYAGFLDNDDRVLEWQAEHDAFHNEIELEREEKKGKNMNLVRDQAAPLRQAYQKMVGRRRTVFLAQIISYITGKTE